MKLLLKTEAEFDNFVRLFGGQKISDIVGKAPPHLNADYLFDEFNVIAELKCLEEDKIKDSNIVKKASKIYEEYLKKNKAPRSAPGTRLLVSTEDLPEEFAVKLANLYKVPIRRRIVEADNQISETKKRLNRIGHIGLLILVNDNNTALAPINMRWALSEIFEGNNFPSIDHILFLTVNLKSEHPDVDKDLLVWMPLRRPGFNGCTDDFLTKFRLGWFSYLESRTGESIPTMRGNEMIEKITNMKKRK